MSYSTEISADSPLVWWRLGDTGSTAADGSGNGRTGTYVASPSVWLPGVSGDSDFGHDFDGATQWITSTYSPFSGDLTFEAWVLRDTTASNDGIMGGDVGSTNGMTWWCPANSDSVSVQRNGATILTWATRINDGRWHHLVLKVDNTSATKTGELYVDKVSLGVQNFTSDCGWGAPANLTAGRSSSTAGFEFDGKQDELAVYSGLLSGARIAAHFDAAVLPAFASVTAAMGGAGRAGTLAG